MLTPVLVTQCPIIGLWPQNLLGDLSERELHCTSLADGDLIPNFGRIFVLENICSKFSVLIKVFKKQQMGVGRGEAEVKKITKLKPLRLI